jgi:hypothetical protein
MALTTCTACEGRTWSRDDGERVALRSVLQAVAAR